MTTAPTSPDPQTRLVGTTEQLSTGVPGLDRILRGGLRRGGLHVILGRPGSGKSVLAHQIGAHHIREQGGSVLYLTAMVESHQTLVSQARTFRFFDPATVADTFYYASLHPSLVRGGLGAMTEEVIRLVRERAVSMLIVDGLHALKLSAGSQFEYQRFVHEVESLSALLGVTTLLITHPRHDGSSDPTFTIADGIIRLRTCAIRMRSVRQLAVVKLRGVGHVSGWHSFAITAEGIRAYPRLEAIVSAEGLPMSVPDLPRAGFDVEGLDAMIGGGLPSSSVTLVAGTPGSGKTMLTLAFLSAGVARGEPGVYVGFHETPDRLVGKADGVGLRIRDGIERGLVHIDWRPPSELLVDELGEQVLALVERHGARRLVLNALDDFERATLHPDRRLPFFSALLDILRARGVTTLVTHDMPRIAGPNFDLPFGEVSPIVDNMLHTRFAEIRSDLRRIVAVLKMREGGYDSRVREFFIEPSGMRVGDPFVQIESLLTGVPHAAQHAMPPDGRR